MTKRERRVNVHKRESQLSYPCNDCCAHAGRPCTMLDPVTGDVKTLKHPHRTRGQGR